MLIGEVVGRLWASRQAEGLGGRKMLLVRPLEGRDGRLGRRLLVAIDALGAGPGERVIVARGSRVRDVTVGAAVADKDVVIGIVDGVGFDDGRAAAAGAMRQAASKAATNAATNAATTKGRA